VKARRVVLPAAGAAAVAGLVWWRRRSAAPPPAVQLALSDGAVHVLSEADSSRIELEALATGVRDSLTGGI
jgi:hypothetical protein